MTQSNGSENFFKLIVNAPNIVKGDNRMSRAAAMLFFFAIGHSFPNALLLFEDGPIQFDEKARHMINLPGLIYVEIYLAIAFIVHAFLALKNIIWIKKEYTNTLLITGLPLLLFIVKHSLDFRFGGFQNSSEEQQRPYDFMHNIMTLIPEKVMYSAGVLVAGAHSFNGIKFAFFHRLGFRADQYIKELILFSKAMIIIITCLYFIPILKIKAKILQK